MHVAGPFDPDAAAESTAELNDAGCFRMGVKSSGRDSECS